MATLKVGLITGCLVITQIQSAILDNPSILDASAKSNHEQITIRNELGDLQNRQQRFFNSVKMNLDSANELDSSPAALEKIDEDPNTALSGVYTDCLANLSFPCLQRKILIFLDRLGRMAKFNLIGNFLSVVRMAKETRPLITEDILVARKVDDEQTLKTMIDSSIDEFFEDHVIRVAIPAVLADGGRTASVLDFRVGDNFNMEEGRMKKKKGGGKMKGMKKMMMMGCMMMMGKAAMIAPLIMGISGLAAIKALIFSTMALTISKIIILKKLKMMMGKGGSSGWSSSGGSGGWPSSGGGGSGGWSSGGGGGGGGGSGGWSAGGAGGGGGWPSGGGGDRSFDSHTLAYQGYR